MSWVYGALLGGLATFCICEVIDAVRRRWR
jgi:hypothetical protein